MQFLTQLMACLGVGLVSAQAVGQLRTTDVVVDVSALDWTPGAAGVRDSFQSSVVPLMPAMAEVTRFEGEARRSVSSRVWAEQDEGGLTLQGQIDVDLASWCVFDNAVGRTLATADLRYTFEEEAPTEGTFDAQLTAPPWNSCLICDFADVYFIGPDGGLPFAFWVGDESAEQIGPDGEYFAAKSLTALLVPGRYEVVAAADIAATSKYAFDVATGQQISYDCCGLAPAASPGWSVRISPAPVFACSRADVATGTACGNGGDGVVSLTDFSCYLSQWAAGAASADITTTGDCLLGINGGDGVDLSDFSCFLAEWASGCP